MRIRYFVSIILVSLFFDPVSAQHEWAPIGAEWYYSYREGAATPATGYFHLKTLKDTLIGSKECKVIAKHLVNSTGETSFQGYEYIYTDIDGNKVYRYLFEEFYLLYDFNNKTGDTLVVKVPSSVTNYDSITLVVETVSQIKLSDSVSLRTQKLKPVFELSSPGYKFNGEIIENIGNLYYFFPYYEIDCDGGCPQPLRCYSDTKINYQTYSQIPCDTIYTSAKELKADAGNDLIVCQGDENEYIIGGFPTASGGTGPYTYSWSGKFYDIKHPTGEPSWIFASDFLDDTTKSNPTIKEWRNVPEEWTTFYLKVEDAAGNIQYDSVRIITSLFMFGGPYKLPVTIQKGDSVRFFGNNSIFTNFEPFTKFIISPSHGLSDSTDIYGWAKPDTSTTYYIQAVNAAGCTSSKISYWHIEVNDHKHEWAPIGAKWHYTAPYFDPIFTRSPSCIVIESAREWVIAGLPVKVLEIRSCLDQNIIARAYIRQKRESVFYYHQKDEKFYLLYNFAAKVGDTITVHDSVFELPEAFLYGDNKTADTFKYKIVEIDSININGNWHKRQKVKAVSPSFWGFYDHRVNSYIIEKIGNTVFFFGRHAGTIPEETAGQLRCYSDEKTIYQSPEWPSICDLVLSTKSVTLSQEGIQLYPNPASDYLTIEPVPGMQSVSIFSVEGRLILVENVNENHGPVTIQVGHLQPGTYIVKLVTSEIVMSKIFIKGN